MQQKKSGRIIVVSSRLAQQPLPRLGAYAAAKSALESMANTMAIELGPLGKKNRLLAYTGVLVLITDR